MTQTITPEPSGRTLARLTRMLGWKPMQWRSVSGGYTPTARFLLESGGRSAFAKVATTEFTASLLRREIEAYQCLSGPFMPGLIAADTDGAPPILIIEALNHADWPPPWTSARVDAVLASVDQLHARSAPLRPFAEHFPHRLAGNWRAVAKAPDAFLALGLASRDWLMGALPELIAAEAACRLEGDAPCHFDLRSDNLCIGARGAILIDWAEASLSNPALDIGAWLPSLQMEGGPEPETILPHAPEIAAWICGFFAARAGQPLIPTAPYVRQIQLAQLKPALAWVKRALRL